MKILITGGAGFIASHIADRYLTAGHEVVIIDDLSTGNKKNLPPKARFYEISIADPGAGRIIEKERPDILNHHAAQIDVRRSVADPAWDAEINIVASIKILESCRKAGVQKVIFASSGGAIYGEQDIYPADESHRTDPVSPYGIGKLTVEKYLYFYFKSYGIPFVALRYANVYGPRQNSLGEAGVISIFASKLLRGERPTINGDGTQTRDFVFVEDVAACNFAALNPEVRGIFNVGTGKETDINFLTRTLVQLTSSPLQPTHAAAKPGEQMRSCLKPGALQRETITPLPAGLEKTVMWFKKNSHPEIS